MTDHNCRGDNCGICEHRISAAEDNRNNPTYSDREADRACDQWEMSTRLGERW